MNRHSQLRPERPGGVRSAGRKRDAFLLEAAGVVSLCTHNARISDMVQIGTCGRTGATGRGHASAVVAVALVAR